MAERVMAILADAKRLAQEYRALTGKPLGITGEVAEFEAARILGVELTPARQAGYDAVEHVNGTTRRHQVKGRCRLEGSKRSQRLGSIKTAHEWDAVLVVILDQNLTRLKSMRQNARPSSPRLLRQDRKRATRPGR